MPHISLSNLRVAYGNQKVLQNISVDIPNNQITAVIGPSGCGKTTLLKTLNRLVDLYDEIRIEGEVRIDGADIYDPKADLLTLRKKVGFLSQKPYPLPMSIHDNITFGPRIHRMNKEELLHQIQELEKHIPIDSLCPSAIPGSAGSPAPITFHPGATRCTVFRKLGIAIARCGSFASSGFPVALIEPSITQLFDPCPENFTAPTAA